jgi:hypothetical protein
MGGEPRQGAAEAEIGSLYLKLQRGAISQPIAK